MQTTRGERNCNPGNIDRSGIPWEGLAADQSGDSRFCVFTAPEFGIRALAVNLIHYYKTHGLKTVRGMINRWAPPVENDTGAYVHAVAHQVGVDPDDIIDPTNPAVLSGLVRGIIQHENGRIIYDEATISNAVQLALS
jgi:hypothetical protein